MVSRTGGRVLRKVRRIRGLTQTQLAELLGIDQFSSHASGELARRGSCSISRWELGDRRISCNQILAILRALEFGMEFQEAAAPATYIRGGEILKAARQIRGKSQGQVAYICNVSQVYVARFECGQRDMAYDKLLGILEKLDLEPSIRDLRVGNSPGKELLASDRPATR